MQTLPFSHQPAGENLPLVLGLKHVDAEVEGSAVVIALAAAVATSTTFQMFGN